MVLNGGNEVEYEGFPSISDGKVRGPDCESKTLGMEATYAAMETTKIVWSTFILMTSLLKEPKN